MLIFVFARISCGRMRPILAEFAAVPNAPSDAETECLPTTDPDAQPPAAHTQCEPEAVRAERGGPPGPEPTRFGDWERNGRCIDF
jgi:hypothetical protein